MHNVGLTGLDPYDALRGRRVPSWVRAQPRARRAAIQLRKRLPLRMEGLLGVAPFVMAKAAGAFLTAASRRGDDEAIEGLLASLHSAEGDLGGGAWGYEFDVQTRWAFYPAGSPNLIATVFVARGLGTAAVATGRSDLLDGMGAAAAFLATQLRCGDARTFFRYTPTSDRLVHNANLLGAGLCAMSGALRGDSKRVADALECARTSMSAQREDGSWAYGEGSSLGWSDNFHTAYNLDGLLQVWLASGDLDVRASLARGIEHWAGSFFGPSGEPKYYAGRGLPYDIHSAGTAVDLAARLATWGWRTSDLAERVAAWTLRSLVDPRTGLTYYQKHSVWTDTRNFIRWGDAHWALGSSSLALLRVGRRDPLEAAIARASGADQHAE